MILIKNNTTSLIYCKFVISVVGNPLICGQNSVNNCSTVSLNPLSFQPDDLKGKEYFKFVIGRVVLLSRRSLLQTRW